MDRSRFLHLYSKKHRLRGSRHWHHVKFHFVCRPAGFGAARGQPPRLFPSRDKGREFFLRMGRRIWINWTVDGRCGCSNFVLDSTVLVLFSRKKYCLNTLLLGAIVAFGGYSHIHLALRVVWLSFCTSGTELWLFFAKHGDRMYTSRKQQHLVAYYLFWVYPIVVLSLCNCWFQLPVCPMGSSLKIYSRLKHNVWKWKAAYRFACIPDWKCTYNTITAQVHADMRHTSTVTYYIFEMYTDSVHYNTTIITLYVWH